MGKIIIPDKLNVAFQERQHGYSYWDEADTSEKFFLGFSTYYKANGELNVETHKDWGSKEIPLKDYPNDAVEGFEVDPVYKGDLSIEGIHTRITRKDQLDSSVVDDIEEQIRLGREADLQVAIGRRII